jgi:hypothetical protein
MVSLQKRKCGSDEDKGGSLASQVFPKACRGRTARIEASKRPHNAGPKRSVDDVGEDNNAQNM